jgi:hypothetical protein
MATRDRHISSPEDPFAREPAPAYDPIEPARPGGGWREEVMGASGLNFLLGLWLLISPWVLNYGGRDPYWNDIVFGAIFAFIALVRTSGAYRESWLSWLNALIAAWVFVSAFWLQHGNAAVTNNWIVGIVMFILAVWSASATEGALTRRGTGSGARRGYRGGPIHPVR